MPDEPTNHASGAPPTARSGDYVVVARRYRPQVFADLIGQEHVTQALSNAITTNRVGHAYLFTGARGVGKTSAARIYAKALNCTNGPAPVVRAVSFTGSPTETRAGEAPTLTVGGSPTHSSTVAERSSSP